MPKVVKVIEVLAESDKSWEEAAQEAVSHAGKTVRNIRSVYIKEFQGVVENNKIVQFRVDAKISFVVDD
jgi:flavin-binding protein dodecin